MVTYVCNTIQSFPIQEYKKRILYFHFPVSGKNCVAANGGTFSGCASRRHTFFCTRRKIKMFKKNDRYLKIARIVNTVLLFVNICACIIAGGICIYLAFRSKLWLFLLYAVLWIFFGTIISWIVWLFVRLYLSHLYDVKMIRNKLYEIDNSDLQIFNKGYEPFET